MTDPHLSTPTGKPRARALGIPFDGRPGPWNAITDVAGVGVGYATLIAGDGPLTIGRGPVRTGVTAILPRPAANTLQPVFAGLHSQNGNGEMTGSHMIDEVGAFTLPVTITNTHACGIARDATIRWVNRVQPGGLDDAWGLPVAAETYDGELNDINGFHVTAEHTVAALDGARGGPVALGSVGGGTGMICYDFKGGNGSASRVVTIARARYTLGVFLQANFGAREQLTILGVPVGRHITRDKLRNKDQGSIIVLVATDAPLLAHQLKRVARRVPMGLARTGTVGNNGSGDIFLAFSTANAAAFAAQGAGARSMDGLPNRSLDPLFNATVEAVEEAVIDAMLVNRTMVGRDGNRSIALPHDEVLALMRRWGRI